MTMDTVQLTRRGVLKGAGLLGLAAGTGAALDLDLLTPAEQALADSPGAVKLNVLYIGAHPDDEAWTLAAFGQWNEFHHQQVGVITITRGEGGGNAVGLEEGPALGLRREVEERRAVAYAGIEHIFNLDAVDFFYTLSAPLSYDVWGGQAVLNRIIRVVRATRPDVIVTMNPSAVQGNHGNHQRAAMYAVEAYLMAGRRDVFPEHFDEGFEPWTPKRILRSGSTGKGETGPDAVAHGFKPAVASDLVFGTWNGTMSERHGERWSQRLDKAIWEYKTQGWSVIPANPTDPVQIGSAWFTLIASRTPLADPTSGYDAALRGATLPIPGGLPLGTTLEATASSFHVLPGASFTIDVALGSQRALPGARARLDLPQGWAGTSSGFSRARRGQLSVARLTVTPPADAVPGTHVRLGVVVETRSAGTGRTSVPVRVTGAVEAGFEPVTEIGEFLDWTKELGIQHLDALVPTRRTLGQGRSGVYAVLVTNHSTTTQSGTVTVQMPAGVTCEPSSISYAGLAAGATRRVPVVLTNTDPSMPTANRAPNGGVYPVTVSATSSSGEAKNLQGLHLVPALVGSRTSGFTADGVRGEGEFPGEGIDIGSLWEGTPVEPADASGRTWVSYDDQAMYVHVEVTDDVRGSVLVPADDKQRFRTDSVEIMVDPRGNSDNTGSTFILAVVPSLDDAAHGNPPGAGRDHDNHQGPLAETAPGVEVAAKVSSPYTGYQLDVKIPFDVLPDAIDPEHMGFNVVVYDSDTQDRTGQSRIGWSTYPGVQADPRRWGVLQLPGLAGGPSKPKQPVIPSTSAQSVASPASIVQSSGDRVPLGGKAPLGSRSLRIVEARKTASGVVVTAEVARAGVLRAFVWDAAEKVGLVSTQRQVGRGRVTLRLRVNPSLGAQLVAALSLEHDGQVAAASRRIR